MTSPDQPRPTEHAEQQQDRCACQHSRGNHRSLSYGAGYGPCLGIDFEPCGCRCFESTPQHAPSGEPSEIEAIEANLQGLERYPFAQTAQALVAEVRRLRADLAQRTAELERLRSQVDNCQANAHYRAWQESQAELAQVWQLRDQYLDVLQQARAVVLAARAYFVEPDAAADRYQDVIDALDATPAVGGQES